MAEAKGVMEQSQGRWYEADLHRIEGDLLLEQDSKQRAEAQACFDRALGVAREQQAKSLELRAAINLSRLWKKQGRCDEARQLLEPIYRWFTEGLDSMALREAKVLLEELQE